MYTYTWYQWLSFFYLYCFFGWIFESTYVSFKQRRFVNRGFLRAPMLPLYGTGAVMMLWVSLPVKDNLVAVYFSGVIAATILEYITGWGMEKLFKMKYWDYSNQHFQINGYICLSSSIAWGFLTIFLTEVIHTPIESVILKTPSSVLLSIDGVVSVLFVTDTVFSVRTALDLAKILENLSSVRADLEAAQVQLALLKAETTQRVDAVRDDTKNRMERLRSDLRNEVATRILELKDETAIKLEELQENITAHLNAASSSLLDSISPARLEELRRLLADTKNKLEELRQARPDMPPQESACANSALNSSRLEELREEATLHLSELRNEQISSLTEKTKQLMEKRHALTHRLDHIKKLFLYGILRGNPYASSRFQDALDELKEEFKKKPEK